MRTESENAQNHPSLFIRDNLCIGKVWKKMELGCMRVQGTKSEADLPVEAGAQCQTGLSLACCPAVSFNPSTVPPQNTGWPLHCTRQSWSSPTNRILSKVSSNPDSGTHWSTHLPQVNGSSWLHFLLPRPTCSDDWLCPVLPGAE